MTTLVERFTTDPMAAVPEHLRDGLRHYLVAGVLPGSFLTAVLANDLLSAMTRADPQSRAGLFELVMWLWEEAPAGCWGTRASVQAWIQRGGSPAWTAPRGGGMTTAGPIVRESVTGPLFSYHTAHVGLSQSWLHAKMALETPDEPSDVMELGDVAHQVILERDQSRVVAIDAPDWRTKAAREARDAARADGKTPILAHKWAAVEGMVGAVRRQLEAFDPVPFAWEGGQAERSLYFVEDGVDCRATPDWLTLDNRHIWDLKTTSNGHPAAFSRTLWDKGYDLQAALYRRAVFRLFDVLPEFAFVVVETEPPHAVSVVALDPEGLAFANQKLDHALEGWKRCLETGVWPSYPTRVCYVEVPGYLHAQWLERSYYEETTR